MLKIWRGWCWKYLIPNPLNYEPKPNERLEAWRMRWIRWGWCQKYLIPWTKSQSRMNILRPKACRRYEEGGVENTLYLVPWTRSQSPINVLRPGACCECVENGVTKPDICFLYLGDKVQCTSEQYHGVENCKGHHELHIFYFYFR